MRALKILGLAIGGIVALAVIALVTAWLVIDPNDYKDRIAQAVKDSTGRELTMTGDIELSLFPWLALQIGPASLGNPPGFDAEPFAVVQRAALRVRLLPLLRKQLQIGRIEIDGLDLRLRKNAGGKGNWEDFSEERDAAAPGAAAPGAAARGATQPLDLAGIAISNSRISFDDTVASNVDIDVGRVAPDVAIPVKFGLDLLTAPDAQPLHVAGGFSLTTAPDERYRLAAVALEGTLAREGGGAPVPWKFASPDVDIDLAKQTLAQTSFTAQLAAAQVSGTLSGAQIVDAPDLRGDFDLQPVALRDLMTQLGMTPPVTRDAKALTQLAARGGFSYAGDALRAEQLVVQLDDSALKGAASLNLATDAVGFDLSLDRIDVDRYLPPPSTAPKSAKKEPFELPTDALKGLLAKGTLALGQVQIAGIALTEVNVGVDAKDGVTHLAPLKARLYGGQYSGDIHLDSRASVPRLAMEQTMTGIDVAQLLDHLAETRRLSGRGNVTMSLAAQGRNSDALTKSLRGKVNANLADGAVEGLDLWYAISQAQSLIQKQTLAAGSNTGRTAFDTFRMSADVVGGVATTSDLNIVSQQLRVTGKGSTNLATQAINYQVTATVLKSAGGSTLAAIPVNIDGTFDNPRVRPDLEGIARERVKKEIDKRTDELKEKLGDKLKGLFNR